MAKVSRKKAGKKSVKRRSEVVEEKPEVEYDDEEEERHDENIASEEEEEEDDERKRQKLLADISALGGKRRRNAAERSEAAVQMSEFTVDAEGEGDKIDLSELIGTMEKTPAVPSKSTKQLKNLQRTRKTVQSPLSKQESQRIQRDVAFQKASTEVTRWNGIIKQNQRAEQLVFPLNQEPPGPKPMERVVTGWKARTPLEEEIFSLLTANKQPIHDPVLTPAEEASMRAMSLEEAKIRRAELQKARALQSYYESKARRDRRIKSKKYHKVQNRARRKEFLKRFDEMAKADPAAALEELSRMELARMQERMSLKHQNSGKWARSKAVMAKYDEGARKAMQQQLEVNKELTQKVVTSLNNEEEQEEEEVLPDFVNDAEQGPDPSNPWMRGKLSEEPTEEERRSGEERRSTEERRAEEERRSSEERRAEEERRSAEERRAEEEEEVTEEEALLREFDSRRKLRQAQEATPVTPEEEAELSEFTQLFRGIADGCREAEAEATPGAGAQLEEGLTRVRTLEDVELLGQEESAPDEAPVQPPPAGNAPPTAQKARRKRKRGIELKDVLTKDTKDIQVPLAATVEDPEDSEEQPDQRGLIKEAFAGDDVISDFLKDKRRQEDAARPKAVDLTLPGWGDWGGTGLKPSRRKRRRFRIKAAAPPRPRRDRDLPNVIVSEKRNGAVGLHQVNSLPFPFQNQTQFESAVRTPLGRAWNTERTVRKVTKPRVVTRLGAIIRPMAREELLEDRKRRPDASAAQTSGTGLKLD